MVLRHCHHHISPPLGKLTSKLIKLSPVATLTPLQAVVQFIRMVNAVLQTAIEPERKGLNLTFENYLGKHANTL